MVNAADSASVNTLNQSLSPTTAGESHTFTLQDPGSSTTYFSIEFQGDNAQRFGNYPDGFSPQNSMS